jgi:hypothetical protein
MNIRSGGTDPTRITVFESRAPVLSVPRFFLAIFCLKTTAAAAVAHQVEQARIRAAPENHRFISAFARNNARRNGGGGREEEGQGRERERERERGGERSEPSGFAIDSVPLPSYAPLMAAISSFQVHFGRAREDSRYRCPAKGSTRLKSDINSGTRVENPRVRNVRNSLSRYSGQV